MTRDDARDPPDGAITTEDEFDDALHRLLSAAARNGVDPRGARVYRNGESAPDWEVMIHDLAERDGTE